MAAIAAAALLTPPCAHAGRRYASFLLDRTDMSTTLSAPLGLLSTGKSYFEHETLPGGRAHVLDFRAGALEGAYYLEKDILRGRADALLVLDADFGHMTVSVDVDYRHGRESVRVNTGMSRRGIPHQPPRAGKAVKAGLPDGFALVRVFKTSPRFLVAAADYSLDGTLVAFRVEESSGDWVNAENGHSSSHGFGDGRYYAPRIDWAAAARVGLPKTIDPIRFTTDPFKDLPKPEFPIEHDVALVYRDHAAVVDRWTQHGSQVEQTELCFPPNEIERSLLKTEQRFRFSAGR